MEKDIKTASVSKSKAPLYISLALVASIVACYFLIPSVQEFLNKAWAVLTSGDEKRITQWVDGFGWFGTLEILDNRSMYKLRMTNPDAIAYKGTYVNSSDVLFSLTSGWNWIGYTPTTSLELGTALLNIPDGSAEFIKSQSAYADYYNGFGWFGHYYYRYD